MYVLYIMANKHTKPQTTIPCKVVRPLCWQQRVTTNHSLIIVLWLYWNDFTWLSFVDCNDEYTLPVILLHLKWLSKELYIYMYIYIYIYIYIINVTRLPSVPWLLWPTSFIQYHNTMVQLYLLHSFAFLLFIQQFRVSTLYFSYTSEIWHA